MGTKNISDQFQQHITDTIRKVPEIPYIETIEDERLKLFTELCILQRDGRKGDYKALLNWNKKWNGNDFSI